MAQYNSTKIATGFGFGTGVISHAGVDGHQALLAALIYTLATTAVLTAGDLPVYLVES